MMQPKIKMRVGGGLFIVCSILALIAGNYLKYPSLFLPVIGMIVGVTMFVAGRRDRKNATATIEADARRNATCLPSENPRPSFLPDEISDDEWVLALVIHTTTYVADADGELDDAEVQQIRKTINEMQEWTIGAREILQLMEYYRLPEFLGNEYYRTRMYKFDEGSDMRLNLCVTAAMVAGAGGRASGGEFVRVVEIARKLNVEEQFFEFLSEGEQSSESPDSEFCATDSGAGKNGMSAEDSIVATAILEAMSFVAQAEPDKWVEKSAAMKETAESLLGEIDPPLTVEGLMRMSKGTAPFDGPLFTRYRNELLESRDLIVRGALLMAFAAAEEKKVRDVEMSRVRTVARAIDAESLLDDLIEESRTKK